MAVLTAAAIKIRWALHRNFKERSLGLADTGNGIVLQAIHLHKNSYDHKMPAAVAMQCILPISGVTCLDRSSRQLLSPLLMLPCVVSMALSLHMGRLAQAKLSL